MRFFVSLLSILLIPFSVLAAEQPIGSVKTLNGDAYIVRVHDKFPAKIGMPVFQQDVVQTAKSGAIGIIFRDDSIISVGPDSSLDLKKYVFEPQNRNFSIFLKMIKGTFVYISGKIGKLAPDSIQLETPSSIIGVRGTKILLEVME